MGILFEHGCLKSIFVAAAVTREGEKHCYYFIMARLFVLLVAMLSLVEFSTQACPPFTVCTKRRDTIIQDERFDTDGNTVKNAGKSWFIKMESVGNVLLYFKTFNDHGNSVAAFAYKDKQLTDARVFYQREGGFQVLLKDCDMLVLYLPAFESTFLLHRLLLSTTEAMDPCNCKTGSPCHCDTCTDCSKCSCNTSNCKCNKPCCPK